MSSVFSAVHERKFRRDPRDFSRGGPLDPKLLTTLLLYMIADANRRGYPSHEVFQVLNLSNVDFVVRVPTRNTFGIVDAFRESGTSDRMFRLMPPDGSPAHWVPLDVRLVRTTTPDGGESYFITSLRRSEFSLGQLRGLYHLRWEVEEFFKLLKGPYIGQGQFRSKSPSGVLQEIHALVLLLALTRMCMCAAAERIDRDQGGLSQKAAILGVASYATRILMAPEDVALRELDALLQRIARPRYVKRTCRSFPRRSFRPAPRWTSSGRRGD